MKQRGPFVPCSLLPPEEGRPALRLPIGAIGVTAKPLALSSPLPEGEGLATRPRGEGRPALRLPTGVARLVHRKVRPVHRGHRCARDGRWRCR